MPSTTSSSLTIDDADIGLAVQRRHQLRNEEIYKYLCNTWVPDTSYAFPITIEGKRSRKFQLQWLSNFDWLAYSKCVGAEGGFCKFCVLFAGDGAGIGSQALNIFVKSPMKKYKKGCEVLEKHSNTEYHKFSIMKGTEFLKNFKSGESTSVNTLLNKQKQAIFELNKKRLWPIFKTVLLCARNNLPLRGHRDDGALKTEDKILSCLAGNEGVFRALLAFRLDAGDNELKNHLDSAGKNSTMISKTIQNEMISVLGQVIRSKIIEKVQKSKFFSILCDETTDASKQEQLSISVRYVDQIQNEMGTNTRHCLKEDFMAFVNVTETTGVNLKNVIVEELKNAGLSLSNLRGQGYDGASNMSGKYKGVQKLITDEQPLAFYTHCFNHELNLSVSKSCEVVPIRNMIGIVGSVSVFLSASAKRVELLKKTIEEIKDAGYGNDEYKKTKLKAFCETRWVERHVCTQTFDDLLLPIAQCLEKLESDKDPNVSSKAAAFSVAIKRSDFLIALKVVNKVNAYTVVLSRILQSPTLEISKAIQHVDEIINVFQKMRGNASTFDDIYRQAENAATILGTDIQIPRLCSQQTNRSNAGAATPMDYYRINTFYPFLDHYLTSLNLRFKGEFMEVLPLEYLIPKFVPKADDAAMAKIMEAASKYADDLGFVNENILESEINLWREYWLKQAIQPATAVEAMDHCQVFYPHIRILLNILAVIPVTSATAERTFSVLRRLKTYLRSTMVEDRLNGLALANIHKDISIEISELVDTFVTSKPRRMAMSDWNED